MRIAGVAFGSGGWSGGLIRLQQFRMGFFFFSSSSLLTSCSHQNRAVISEFRRQATSSKTPRDAVVTSVRASIEWRGDCCWFAVACGGNVSAGGPAFSGKGVVVMYFGRGGIMGYGRWLKGNLGGLKRGFAPIVTAEDG